MLQLAAAGSFTKGTSGWLRKVLAWHLALVLYKPMAATIYAVAFMLIGDEGNDLQTWLTGVGMLGMTLIALPAMLRFLNWTIGGIQSGGGSLGMLAAAGAAGLHGAASLRGVTDHARDMERRYGGPGPGSPSGASTGSGTTTPTTSPPSYTGPPASTLPTPAMANAGTTATTASSAATSGTATAGAATAAGPAAPVVAGAVVAGQATIGTLKKGAEAATSSQDGAR